MVLSLRAVTSNLSLFPNPLSNESVIHDGRKHKTVVFLQVNAVREQARTPYKFCRFSLSAAADGLAVSFKPAFQRWYTKLKRQWKIAQTCCSPVSARLCYRVSNSFVFVHPAGTLANSKGYPLSNRQSCCHLKKKNTSIWSIILAWSMPMKDLLGDPRQADQRTHSFNFNFAIVKFLRTSLDLFPEVQLYTSLYTS